MRESIAELHRCSYFFYRKFSSVAFLLGHMLFVIDKNAILQVHVLIIVGGQILFIGYSS